METVNNLTSAASRVIWGDKEAEKKTEGAEPVSGETGDVKTGEPYDKGNMGDGPADAASSTVNKTEDTTSTDPKPSTTANLPIRSEHETDKTGVTSHHNPTSATASDKPTSSTKVGAPDDNKSTEKHQASGKPEKDVKGGSDEHERIKETKKEAEEAAAIDTSGPGPRTLEQKAHDEPARGASGGGGDDGPQKVSHGEGTGEKYVKSSGMAADGGDFDATAPGAGKEADRLLEEKGVHHEAGPPKPDADSKSSSKDNVSGVKEKVSLKDKIKAKLHKN